MRLKTLLKEIDDGNPVKVKIGTQDGSGFFYCGTTADLLENEVEYEIKLKSFLRKGVARAKISLDEVERNEPTPLRYMRENPSGDVDGYRRFIAMWMARYKVKRDTFDTRNNYLINCVPLMNRDVVDVRDATAYDEDTKVIIITGNEYGAYWTFDEVTIPMQFIGDKEDDE